jgi:hypothetical protein
VYQDPHPALSHNKMWERVIQRSRTSRCGRGDVEVSHKKM